MKVIFVHHSCFVVEMEDVVLIFDYFEGNRVTGYTFTGYVRRRIRHRDADETAFCGRSEVAQRG